MTALPDLDRTDHEERHRRGRRAIHSLMHTMAGLDLRDLDLDITAAEIEEDLLYGQE